MGKGVPAGARLTVPVAEAEPLPERGGEALPQALAVALPLSGAVGKGESEAGAVAEPLPEGPPPEGDAQADAQGVAEAVAQREGVRVYNRQTVIVRTYGRGNDHNRDALTNAALLKQSILLSRSAASGDQCVGGISKNSNCTTRGGARVVSVSGSRPGRADR